MTETLIGIDVGSSSVKVCLLDARSGTVVAQATSPSEEMEISAPKTGWAEQHPDLWWEHTRRALHTIRASHAKELQAAQAIGIAYQMHGLVLVDKQGVPVRPAIIWCDSRAVEIGAEAFSQIGEGRCLQRFGNSPGNFTASKLAWVRRYEPEVFKHAARFMLPGDFIAFRLTGEVGTTPSGLSEGVLWDFTTHNTATEILSNYGIPSSMVAPVTPSLGAFAVIKTDIAAELGVPQGIPVTYRAGDQPNNALALNVLNPGEIGANAGTSGVVYGVNNRLGVDKLSRVNNFLHVNATNDQLRIGVLMCVNGAGSFYRWIKHTLGAGKGYREINEIASLSPVGARGVIALPYGNGAERTLENRSIGASLEGLDLNRHDLGDIFRAAQEGVVFALSYGVEIMRGMGISPTRVRAGNANMFQSDLFRRTFATAVGAPVELYTTDGSEGAARGAGLGLGLFSFSNAFKGLERELVVEPDQGARAATTDAYERWKEALQCHVTYKGA